MAKFRFRAQAALDLRRREYEQAQRELAESQRDLHLARTRWQQASADVDAAQQAATAQSARATVNELEWYRFWIARLVHERQAQALHVMTREQRVSDAAAACQRAHQRCEALERFREKARRAHDAAESATERKLIDELASRRYAAARAVGGDEAL
jgi:flagellar export protein FliJ